VQGCPGHNTIAAFVDGGLAADEESALEAHIDDCDECRRQVSSLVTSPASRSFVFDSPDLPDEEVPASLVPGARIGRFVVLRVIARGGMGTVARAYDPELDRRVALKLLRPELWRAAGAELRAQLRREAVVMARLAHPNVVTVFDVGTWGEQVFIAMEYVAGSTLARWKDGKSWDERLAACVAAGTGLAAAHRAGVVHRDVKPANILCGDDSRVLVGDFGLAALGDGDAGTVAGTPGYMSPEQMEGRPADERSDQFSFSVTAWEVLTGGRPFPGTTLDEIHAAIRRGPPAARSGGRAKRVLAVLARGLSAAPDERHPSMAALVAAVERAAAPRLRRRWFAAGATLAAAGIGAALLFWPAGAARPRCGDGEKRIAATWNGQRKAALAGAFPGADRFVARIDRQAVDWVTAYGDACRATRERGEQSEVMLDRRMSCLDGQLRELGALLDAVAAGGAEAGRPFAAVEAAHALPRADRCAPEAIAGRGRPATYPDDPARAAKAAEIDRLLEQAGAQHRLARLEPEKALLDRAVAAAGALGDPVRHARALLELGVVQLRMNQVAAARETLQRAALVAAEGHDDETSAEAAAEMLSLVNQEQLHGNELTTWERTLERELARRPNPILRARFELLRGMMAHDKGDLEGALAHAEKGLALAEQAHGPQNPRISPALRFVGGIRTMRGDHAGAAQAIQRAIDLVEASYGPDHPDVAAGLSLLARAVAEGGDPTRAVGMLERSLAIRERVFGPEHPDVAQSLANLATALEMTGDLAGARRAYERALAIEEKSLGKDSWESAPGLTSLAGVLAAQGDPGARQFYQRAVAIYRDKFPPDYPDQTVALAGLGHLLRRSGSCREAAPHLTRALAIHQVHKSEPTPELVADAAACRVVAVSPRRRSSR
jgi:eukaryotic-like serine/threonine-protein kinase